MGYPEVVFEAVATIAQGSGDRGSAYFPLSAVGLTRQEADEIELTFWYNKDRKTYNLSVSPIRREDNFKRTIPMNGVRVKLLDVPRRSDKTRREARNKVTPELVMELLEATK